MEELWLVAETLTWSSEWASLLCLSSFYISFSSPFFAGFGLAAPPGADGNNSGRGVAPSSDLSAGAIAGIVLGSVACLLLVLAALLWWSGYGKNCSPGSGALHPFKNARFMHLQL